MKALIGGVAAAFLAGSAWAQTPPPGPTEPPAAAPAAAPQPAPQPAITWQVERRFRLWDIPAFGDDDRAQAEALYLALGHTQDPNVLHDEVVKFVRAHRTLQSKGHWDKDARAFKPGFVYARSYVVRIGLANGAAFPGQTCTWSTTAGALDLHSAPCDASVAVTLPALPSGEGAAPVQATVAAGSGATATAAVQVKDRLIVSFGDSFASGEGNPDVPANLAALTGGWGSNGGDGYKQVWVGRDAMNGVKGPAWIDPACHRSSFNQHLVAALKYAADRPHEAVTFLSYACSGAAIFNGLLTAQAQPPGYRDNDSVAEQDISQIEAATRDLCPPDAAGASTGQEIAARTYLERIRKKWWWDPDTTPVRARAFACAEGRPHRKVDAVLLSDGGNDAGFSAVILWALLPRQVGITDIAGTILLDYLRNNNDIARAPDAAAYVIGNTLSPNLQTLAKRLREFGPAATVVVGAYPSPVRDTANAYCGPVLKTQPGADHDPTTARLAAVRAAVPDTLNLQSWKVVIDRQDGGQIEPVVVQALNNRLETTSDLLHWDFVKSGASKADDHGWCAGDPIGEVAVLPDYDADTGQWKPWRPYEWDPYLRRARFFRTPNDAALTQLPDSPRGLNPAIDIIVDEHGRALLAAFTGAFHPTFQAHAVMGLDLAQELERKLPAAGP